MGWSDGVYLAKLCTLVLLFKLQITLFQRGRHSGCRPYGSWHRPGDPGQGNDHHPERHELGRNRARNQPGKKLGFFIRKKSLG